MWPTIFPARPGLTRADLHAAASYLAVAIERRFTYTKSACSSIISGSCHCLPNRSCTRILTYTNHTLIWNAPCSVIKSLASKETSAVRPQLHSHTHTHTHTNHTLIRNAPCSVIKSLASKDTVDVQRTPAAIISDVHHRSCSNNKDHPWHDETLSETLL